MTQIGGPLPTIQKQTMKDFLSNDITPGCYLARGGKGNGSAEYGMILYRCLAIKGDKLSVERMQVDYAPSYQAPGTVTIRKSTLANPNSVVVVTPPDRILVLWDAVLNGTVSASDRTWIGNWIHGTEKQHPWG